MFRISSFEFRISRRAGPPTNETHQTHRFAGHTTVFSILAVHLNVFGPSPRFLISITTLLDDVLHGLSMLVGHEFFLGGQDLEMATIRRWLMDRGETVHDQGLSWGARASAYAAEIDRCLEAGRTPVLIELEDDLAPRPSETKPILLIDHHGDRAGKDVPTSLEQVFELTGGRPDDWSRKFALVAANDRGHIRGMQAIGATPQEIQEIREADRRAQGITAEEERLGAEAAARAEQHLDGRLTVVHLPHIRSATVTDALDPALGGRGFENLVIRAPNQTLFFGSGRSIAWLRQRHPGGWWGGELPQSGFWGIARAIDEPEVRDLIQAEAQGDGDAQGGS